MKLYSIISYARREVSVVSPDLCLEQGRNVFTVVTEDIEQLLARLEALDVTMVSVNCVEQSPTTLEDLFLAGESLAVLNPHAG